MSITLLHKIDAIKRELLFRRRMYPRWIAERRMNQDLADHQIAVMEAILADYMRQEAETRLL